jgi:hypothetical protein
MSVSHGAEGAAEEAVTGGMGLQMLAGLIEALISTPGSLHWQSDGARRTTVAPSSGWL